MNKKTNNKKPSTKNIELFARLMNMYGVEPVYLVKGGATEPVYVALVLKLYRDADRLETNAVKTTISVAPVSKDKRFLGDKPMFSEVGDPLFGVPMVGYEGCEKLAAEIIKAMTGRKWQVAGVDRPGLVFKSAADLRKQLKSAYRAIYCIGPSIGKRALTEPPPVKKTGLKRVRSKSKV